MIRISKLADKIAEKCFSEDEKGVLEYTSGIRKMSIAAQIKFHYPTACWPNDDEEALFDAICITKEENKELYFQLDTYNRLLKTALNPMAHDEVYIRLEGATRFSKSIGINADQANTVSNSTGDTTSKDRADSWSLGEGRSAGGDADNINSIDNVWDGEVMNRGEPAQPATDTKAVPEEEPHFDKVTTHNDEIQYRSFSQDRSKSEDVSKTTTNEKVRRDDEGSSKSSSANINANDGRSNRNITGRKYKTGEQIVTTWNQYIPKIRSKYWDSFAGLFIYERYY